MQRPTKSKNNTRTIALEPSVELTRVGGWGQEIKTFLQQANITLGPYATLNTEIPLKATQTS